MQAERLALALAREGNTVEILTRRIPGTPRSESEGNVKITRLPTLEAQRLKLLALVPSVFGAVLARRGWFDVVHTHQAFHPSFAAVSAASYVDKPSVVKVGNSGPGFDLDLFATSFPRPLCRWMVRRLASQARCFISLNDDIERRLRQHGVSPQRIRAIPNGVPVQQPQTPDRRAEARIALGLSPHAPMLISVGNLHPKKNQAVLIEALRILAGMGLHPTLILAGEGPLKASLGRHATDLGVSEQVRFLGSVADLWPYLYAADVFVMTSLHEGLSNALLEAMAVGLPVVATNVPGNRTVIQDGRDGFLVSNGDALHLAQALKVMLTDRKLALALGASAHRTVRERYDITHIAAQYRDLYAELVENAAMDRARSNRKRDA